MSARLRPVPESPERAVLYGRVSAVMDRGDDLISPELQEQVDRDYAARRGYQVVAWFVDIDRTGRSWSRRHVEQAVLMVERGEADVIVVPRWNRFTRNLRDYVMQTARIEAAGGRLEAALEETDPATAAGLLQRDLFAILAQWESRKIGEGWRETHQRRRDRGLPHAGYPRIGYRYIDKAYVVDREVAPIVVELYHRYVAGEGFDHLAGYLNDRGVISPRTGRPWTGRGIRYSMDAGFAAGLLHFGGAGVAEEWRPGAHEAIIDGRLWDAYQAARRRRHATPPRLVSPSTVLSGLVRCAGCGYGMRVKGDARYGPRYMYVCEHKACDRPASVTRERAEAAVLDFLRALANDLGARAAATVAHDARRAVAGAEARMLGRQLVAVDQALRDLVKVRVADRRRAPSERMPESVYEAERLDLMEQRARITVELAQIEAVRSAPQPSPRQVRPLLQQWRSLPVADRRAALSRLVGAVVVVRGERARASLFVVPAWECRSV